MNKIKSKIKADKGISFTFKRKPSKASTFATPLSAFLILIHSNTIILITLYIIILLLYAVDSVNKWLFII